MDNYGYIKVAAASPKLKVANPDFNAEQIRLLMRTAEAGNCAAVVFPELSLTGYTCGDLFQQRFLLQRALHALERLLEETKDAQVLAVVGMPLVAADKLYNCAVAVQRGKILGVVPKRYLPNCKEYYEKRWFASGEEDGTNNSGIKLFRNTVPFGNLLFHSNSPEFSLGVEVCEDLWAPIPRSSYLAINGANVIANLSADNELAAKSEYRRQLVAQQSAGCLCGYIYASAGVHESTTDMVFSGDCLIAENGNILKSSVPFSRENGLIECELDIESLQHERRFNTSFAEFPVWLKQEEKPAVVEITYNKKYIPVRGTFSRKIPRNPFVPDNPATVAGRCEEIFQIQVAGLAKRIEHTGLKKLVIGVSGGLDSTLALLVARKTCELLELPAENILALTMPGFGTTDETHRNALELMTALEVGSREIDIIPACLQHFQDLGHDPALHDVTYENVQARERTQILMDLANKYGGLVIGTGDLSELALGWCTFNGDHMSMYAVNCGVPKTLVRFLIQHVADHFMTPEVRNILLRILNTPISPELLPPDPSGRIEQKTEDIIGPYELHDFFLFYTLRYGMEPAKVLFLAEAAFAGKYERGIIAKWLTLFYKRFFRQQFKRSCLPDGPKVGSVSLSPRGDWRMPSDAEVDIWLAEMDRLTKTAGV